MELGNDVALNTPRDGEAAGVPEKTGEAEDVGVGMALLALPKELALKEALKEGVGEALALPGSKLSVALAEGKEESVAVGLGGGAWGGCAASCPEG